MGDVAHHPRRSGLHRASRIRGAVAHNLPVAVSSFVGRSEEQEHLLAMLRTTRLVTLAGPPGVGKTRLAIEVAANHGPDGVWLVELAGVADGDQVAQAIASVLGVHGKPDVETTARIAAALADKDLLLVLDNCEHLLETSARVAVELLRACARLTMLVTSREPLGVDGEYVWRVHPLALPPAGEQSLETLLDNSAVRLFTQRAAGVRPKFCLSDVDAPSVVEICRRLDGVPLAIEVAAARMDALSPQEIVEQLNHRLRLLDTRVRRHPSTHRTLHAALDWSFRLLEPTEAALLRRLTVFAGTWNLRAAEAVCSGRGIPAHRILRLLDALVRKSLVIADFAGPETRYRLLEIIREHAASRLNDGERVMTSSAHCRWYVACAEKADAERGGLLRQLDPDRENLRAAFDWATSQADTDSALALAASLVFFWHRRGENEEGRRWLNRALGGEGGSRLLRARALRAAGLSSVLAGDPLRAAQFAEESLTLAEEHQDLSVAHRARMLLHVVSLPPNPGEALKPLRSTVAEAREQGDPRFLFACLEQLGLVLLLTGDARGARQCFEEGLNISLQLGDAAEALLMFASLGRVGVAEGEFELAEKHLREALSLSRDLGERGDVADILSWLGEVARGRGDLLRAKGLFREALTLAKDAALPPVVARCLCLLGYVALAEGDRQHARSCWGEALDSARRIGRPYIVVRALLGLAEADLDADDVAGARERFEEARTLARSTGDRHAIATALHGLGDAASKSGRRQRAQKLYQEALSLRSSMGDPVGVVRSLEALACVACASGQEAAAARWLAASQALRDRGGYARTPTASAAQDACIGELRSSLGAERFSNEWARGSVLTAEDAVADAAQGESSHAKPSKVVGALTSAEHGVASLAAQRFTSREIGERLFISRRTVDAHLAHIFVKLGIRSRRELRQWTLESPTNS